MQSPGEIEASSTPPGSQRPSMISQSTHSGSFVKYIFLDIDGVLNDHERHANGYTGLKKANVDAFNWLLKLVPDHKIIISSAWRYMGVTPLQFEYLLLTHGVDCSGRVKGFTRKDADKDEPRIEQIKDWLRENAPDAEWFAIDDLDLGVPSQIKCGYEGLTEELVKAYLNG